MAQAAVELLEVGFEQWLIDLFWVMAARTAQDVFAKDALHKGEKVVEQVAVACFHSAGWEAAVY